MFNFNKPERIFLVLICALLLISNKTNAQADTAIYKTFGAELHDQFNSTLLDDDSNVLFAGFTSSPNEFSQFGYLLKADTMLNKIWSVVYGDGNSTFTDVTELDGYYIATGHVLRTETSYDVLVVKFDFDGNVIWEKFFGGDDWDFADSIEPVNGGLLLTGHTFSNTIGGADGMVIKIDPDGNELWTKKYGTNLSNKLYDSAEFLSGHLVFSGESENEDGITQQWVIRANSDGEVLYQKLFGSEGYNAFNSVLTDPFNEHYYFSGEFFNSESETQDATMGGLDSAGNVLWIDTLDSPGLQSSNNLEFGQFNELISSGFTIGGNFGGLEEECYMKRMTRQGSYIFLKSFGTEGSDIAHHAIRFSNGYILAGETDGLGYGQKDAFAIRTRNSGHSTNHGEAECLEENFVQVLSIAEASDIPLITYDSELKLVSFSKETFFQIFDSSGRLIFFSQKKLKEYNLVFKPGIYIVKTKSGETLKLRVI